MSKAYTRYFERLRALLDEVEGQGAQIEEAAAMMAECIAAGGVVHVFGSGHSHMMAEEVFYRAGGLFAFNAMLDVNLTSFGTLKAGMVERTEGYANVVLESFDVRAGEVVVIVSNSGINPVPIELAIGARERGAKTVGITSAEKYAPAASRYSTGKKLVDVVDLVVDSRVPVGDGILMFEGVDSAIGASSTVLGAALMNAIVAQVAEDMLAAGHQPPVIVSMNVPNGDEKNRELRERYRDRLQLLKD
ncbi:MAG: SIS domain-containing protein [Thermomicrobiales bacterium]|nr:SIS domain-containing protein [Thermomicrobiales bacterium]